MTRCHACGFVSQENDLFLGYVTLSGDTVILCRDGTACARRVMQGDGVKLLPHPKNPEPKS